MAHELAEALAGKIADDQGKADAESLEDFVGIHRFLNVGSARQPIDNGSVHALVVRFSKTITVRGEPFGCAQESLVEPLLPANIGLRQAQAERIICNRFNGTIY